ncbi:small heat shock protein [Umbelopsis sp. PMI_123]|jgi:HSP20 family protein|nr:small heat shock protein [Umbelopsis sp. PMI_123]
MSLISTTDPNFDRIERRLNQVFDHFFTDLGLSRRGQQTDPQRIAPALDIYENDKSWQVHTELPGVKKEDIKLETHGNNLVISGDFNRSSEQNENNVKYQERRYGAFQRTIPLPENVDKNNIKANYNDGVLEIAIPKSAEASPKKITIA